MSDLFSIWENLKKEKQLANGMKFWNMVAGILFFVNSLPFTKHINGYFVLYWSREKNRVDAHGYSDHKNISHFLSQPDSLGVTNAQKILDSPHHKDIKKAIRWCLKHNYIKANICYDSGGIIELTNLKLLRKGSDFINHSKESYLKNIIKIQLYDLIRIFKNHLSLILSVLALGVSWASYTKSEPTVPTPISNIIVVTNDFPSTNYVKLVR